MQSLELERDLVAIAALSWTPISNLMEVFILCYTARHILYMFGTGRLNLLPQQGCAGACEVLCGRSVAHLILHMSS